MSELMIRDLAASCAREMAPMIEKAVTQIVRDQLPETIKTVLQKQYPGETVRIYSAKKPASIRRDRDAAIRQQYNGHNVKELSARFGLSQSMVFKIISGKK